MDAAERRATVLKAIVEEYVRTAQPVASQTITEFTRSRRLERDRPQRHDPARARGLPRAAPHLCRSDPDRPGLPLLRRPLHRGGCAPGRTTPGRRRLLRVDAPGARGPAPRDQPAARPTHEPRRGGRRARRRRRAGAHGPARRARAGHGARGRGARERLRRDGGAALERRRRPPRSRVSGLRRRVARWESRRRACIATPPAIPRSTRSSPMRSTRSPPRARHVSDHLYVGGASRLAAEQDAFATTATTARLLEMLEEQVVVVSVSSATCSITA